MRIATVGLDNNEDGENSDGNLGGVRQMKCKICREVTGQKVPWNFLLSTKGEDVSASYLVAVLLDVGLVFDVGWRSIYNVCQGFLKHVTGAVSCWFDVGRHSFHVL